MWKILKMLMPIVFCTVCLHIDKLSVSADKILAIESSADESATFIGTCGAEGDNITWSYDVETKTLTFSGTGAMASYYTDNVNGHSVWQSPPWLKTGCSVCHVVYEQGITDIDYVLSDFFEYAYDEEFPRNQRTITIPESVERWKGSLPSDFIIRSPYGSAIYYAFNHRSNFIADGVANNPQYKTAGTSVLAGSWNFDYVTGVLTIQGVGFVGRDEVPDYPIQSIVIASNVTIPENPVDIKSDYNIYVLNWLSTYTQGESKKAIYYTKGSDFEKYYKQMPDSILEKTANYVIGIDENKEELCGDINLDGEISLIDVIFLNKTIAGSITSFSTIQQKNADANADGIINNNDSILLLRYLMRLETTLPTV